MRQIHPSRNVAHLWASKAQSYARNSSGSLFFEGDTIYSYGQHFPIARHVERKGKQAIFFTTRKHSITTSGHISIVRRSIPASVLVIYVDDPATTKLDEYLLGAIHERIGKITLAALHATRHTCWHLDEITDLRVQYSQVAKFLGLRHHAPDIPADIKAQIDAKIAKQSAQESIREQQRREKEQLRAEKWERANKATIEAWLAGQSVHLPSLQFDLMRIKNDMVETSRNAQVPIEHVHRIAPLLISLIKEGKPYQRNGHSIHLGPYVIESLDANGVLTVGCHRFEKAEVLRIGELIAGSGKGVCRYCQAPTIDGKHAEGWSACKNYIGKGETNHVNAERN